MTLTIVEDRIETVKGLLEEAMGRWHAYYAVEALESGIARHLVALLDNKPAGAVIYYTLPTATGGKVTVIYYVVVAEWARKEHLGSALVLSAEEVSGAEAYIATIAEGNEPSIRMFESIGYEVAGFEEVRASYGSKIVRIISRVTCGHEDSYIAYKPGEYAMEVVGRLQQEVVEVVFQRICYEPWRKLRGRAIRI